MANPVRQSNGRWRYQPIGPDGSRLSIRWDGVSDRQAAEIAGHIDELIVARSAGVSVPPRTVHWLNDIGPRMHDTLAESGLVDARRSSTLAALFDEVIATSSNEPSTITRQKSARSRLVEFFGPDRDLASIGHEDARAWHRWMLRERRLAEATVARDVGIARQFFSEAEQRGLIEKNPFRGLSSVVRPDHERQRFITPEDIAAVLDACPSAEWRALVTLARFGGLRVPSEICGMRWADVLWDKDRFLVRSPKTRRHRDGGRRHVPLYPEVRSVLVELFDLAEPGAERVFTMDLRSGINLRKPFQAIITRAGIKPWPKLWQNLRSSRQTELAHRFPSHLVCAWMGNSERVADLHYLQVTETDFRAAAGADPACTAGAPAGAASRRRGLQGVPDPAFLTQEAASGRTEPPESGRYRTRTCDPQCVILVR